MADCGFPPNAICVAGNIALDAAGDAINNMAKAVQEASGKAVASVGTMWVNIGTPNLTGSGGGSSLATGSSDPNAGNITTVIGYVMWITLAICILSLIALGAVVATRMHSGEGMASVGKLGLILGAVIGISGASALISGLLPAGPTGAGGAVAFLQSGLWWYMGAAAIVSVIIGAGRMAWEQRAEPGRETVKGLLTLIVVAGSGVTIVGLLVAAADSFSVWILNSSLNCDVTAQGGACFGTNLLNLLALTTNPSTGGLGSLLVIFLGVIALLAAVFQIVLMVARGGMLVILTGDLPLSASLTNTEMGKSWFRKNLGWLIAFILYKPAAALVYATAFQLAGTDIFKDDGSGLVAVLTGLMLMVIALFAMPALMRFVTPMVGAIAGGAGGAVAAGAIAALPSGAVALGRLASGRGSAGSQGGVDATSTAEPSGSSGGGSTSGAAQTAGTQAAGAGAAAGGGAAGGAASAGAASGGAAAGAAGGPVGLAAGAALDVGMKAGRAAAGAARGLGEQSTGEGGGPDGSR